MGYLSLYREFRPRTFSEVVGQAHITGTLINQIKAGRIGHAYLFTGSRGVGKTTCARIFARAINCSNPTDGSPCYACEACVKLENASNLDITEIDAASNNGVDDARELRERVKYPPVHGKYKVFIIDEVHMLTGSAFNALLKTLEEPPPHVVFILATTESYKLPATILSGVLRFDFRLLPNREIEQIIADAYKKSDKEFEEDAVRYIASLGEGSPRDALSIADRCLNVNEGTLHYADVLELLGAAGQAEIKNLTANLCSGNIGSALESIDTLIKSGKSVGMIAKDLLSYSRDLLIAKAAPSIIELPKTQKDELISAASAVSVELLTSLIQIFSSIDTELRYSVSPRTIIETACIRACKLGILDLSALEERIKRLEKQIATANSGALFQTRTEPASPSVSSQKEPIKPIQYQTTPPSYQPDNNYPQSSQPLSAQDVQPDPRQNIINRDMPDQPDPRQNIINRDMPDQPDPRQSAINKDILVQQDPRQSAINKDIISQQEPNQTLKAGLPSARSLWGRILTHLRTNAPQTIYAIASEIGDIKLEGTTLKIVCGRDNYLAVSSQETNTYLTKAVTELGYDGVDFQAVLVDSQADMDREIKKLKSLIGGTPLKIND